MSRITAAYAAHAAITVTGIKIYDLDDELSVAEMIRTMPCMFPTMATNAAPLRTTSTLETGQNTYTARFYCAVQRSGAERGDHVIRPAIATAIDAYVDALLANPQLRTDPDDASTKTINGDTVVSITATEYVSGDPDTPALLGFEVVHEWLFLIDNRS